MLKSLKTLGIFGVQSALALLWACNNQNAQGPVTSRAGIQFKGQTNAQLIKGDDGQVTQVVVETQTTPPISAVDTNSQTLGSSGGSGLAGAPDTNPATAVETGGPDTLADFVAASNKDCSVHTYRKPGDICGYDFCGGDAANAFLQPAAYKTVKAIMAYLKDKEQVDPANCKNEDVITMLENLQSLEIQWNGLSDLTPLLMLSNLQSLDISHNYFTEFTALRFMSQLTSLRADSNSWSDLKGLSALLSLTHLTITNSQIRDISALKPIMNLQFLDISQNYVGSIVFLTDRNIAIKANGNTGILDEANTNKISTDFDNCIIVTKDLSDFFGTQTVGAYQCRWGKAQVLFGVTPKALGLVGPTPLTPLGISTTTDTSTH